MMPCNEKTTLLTEYQRASELYSAAVSELSKQMGGRRLLPSEYEKLHRATEMTRHASSEVLKRLDRHLSQHSC